MTPDSENRTDKQISSDSATPQTGEKPKAELDEGSTVPNATHSTSKVVQDGDSLVDIPSDVSRGKISGVFSTQTVAKVGTGTTTRKMIQKAYWFAEQNDNADASAVMVQPLNKHNVPSGPKDSIPMEDFLQRFNPELEFYQQEVFPRMKELNTTLKRAEEQRDQGALYSAEFEYAAALDFDEENVRANFGLGLTYMERGEPAKAEDIFERVVGLDASFAPEHKHLFNEFGISLRKSNLLDQAVEYYTRALEITQDDENLYYNLARAFFERGDKDDCTTNLDKALSLNPSFEEANKFLAYIKKQDS
ncbi:tetratricopeptide repeat protein [Pseudodesulfovibrio piezophilus]|uniref:TPR repeat-containing protein n=1 Tax=Pseudodesulfovibrio piezophilus (strain DSM 21447 / JCM 15486 / C1TLV30) TaxID=1322246 RepID=M1WRX0_PSEP2|nr:tetratricopeptide repeat protein [Pseudodesulfovibrio piezophilus]CCH49814.1 TPR repeat-containing protein [Pseudodesulfovibrio piezophilus C1TLV30]